MTYERMESLTAIEYGQPNRRVRLTSKRDGMADYNHIVYASRGWAVTY